MRRHPASACSDAQTDIFSDFPELGRRDQTGKEEAGLFNLETRTSQRAGARLHLTAFPEGEMHTSTAGRDLSALEGDGSKGGGGANQGTMNDALGLTHAQALLTAWLLLKSSCEH